MTAIYTRPTVKIGPQGEIAQCLLATLCQVNTHNFSKHTATQQQNPHHSNLIPLLRPALDNHHCRSLLSPPLSLTLAVLCPSLVSLALRLSLSAMSPLLLLAATLLAVLSCVAAQTCQTPPPCSSSPTVVPTAWYNLTFSVAPTATTPTFTYETTDNVDIGCGFIHTGLAKFAGGASNTVGNYIDLSAPIGSTNSSGIAPLGMIGGLGTGRQSDGTSGWSFEWTFRSGVEAGNAKIFAIGAGQAVWNIFAGPDGGGTGATFGVYGGAGNYANGASGIVEIINPVSTSQWYHVVAVAQNISNYNAPDGAAWFIYINGALLNYTGVGIYLNSKAIQQVARPMAYLGKSDWTADPYWTGIIDTFRIYDKALTGAQVTTLYQGEMGGCPVPTQSTTINNVVPTPNILPRTATGTVSAIYSLTFDQNPCTGAAGSCSYGWELTSSSDSPTLQNVHRGMLTLNGVQQWADLTQTSGPYSVSSTAFPQLGGVPSTTNPGWSFELVMKLGVQENWGKILDLGSTRTSQGVCNNDIVLGWDANNLQFQFDVCDGNGREYQTGDAMGPLTVGAWYHMVVVAQPVIPSNGLANYLSYVNGQLYTAEANYPMIAAVNRQNAWFGRSNWQGGDANFSAEVDAFNIYNVALSDVQIAALAATALGGSTNTGPSTCSAAITCQAASSAAVVPTAWYNLTFSTNPQASGYGWAQNDAGDNGCPFVHRGVASFSGGTSASGGQYADLTAATGTYGVGTPLPGMIGGLGTGRQSDGTSGWSFEWTFRSGVEAGNAKIFAIGAGQAVWNIFAGPDGGGTGATFGVYGGAGNYANGASGIVEIINPVSTSQWYHVVAVAQNISNYNAPDGAAWFIYINGALLNYTGVGIYLNSKAIQQVARPMAYLGKSDWTADPYWTGIIDTFRIYDKALTGAQVTTLYQGEMGGCPVPTQSTTINNVVPTPNILPRTATGTVSAIYSLTFDQNPCTGAAGSCSYGWELTSSSDSPTLQNVHRGMLTLNGVQQWADLTQTSGPYSVSSTAFPQLGGVPSTTNPGWSFELVMKLGVQENWGKILDLGSTRTSQGVCNNDIVLGWDANNLQFQFDVCDGNGREYQTGDAMGPLTVGAWYHMVVVAQPVIPSNGLANYLSYVNGQLYTAEANYPMIAAVNRQNAWFGRSNWQGGDANFSAEVDAFNIYNVALSDVQIAALAATALGGSTNTGPSTCSAAITCQAASSAAVVPTAWYNLTFSTNPQASGYGWAQNDAGDNGCPFVHQGVASFSGGTAASGGQYANLSSASGPYGVGTPLPGMIGGLGSGSQADGTSGWSFEWTFRSGVEAGNAKIFAIGAGEAVWNIFAGPDGGGTGANFGVYGGAGNYANGASGIVEFVNPISTTTWYHVVAVAQNITTYNAPDGAAYFLYVNGQLLNYTGVGIYLNSKAIQQVARPFAYLGKSDWGADPYWTGLIDTFRIYDRALTQSQIYTLYQGEMGGCPVPTSAAPSNVVTAPNILPRPTTPTTVPTPFWGLTFDRNPCAAGSTCNYAWERVSPLDDASQQTLHNGILRINMDGATTQFADLGVTSGPQAVSTTALPMIGGLPATSNPGWTFEFVLKPGAPLNWAKVLDIGSTRSANNMAQCNNDIVLGWDGGTTQWQFDTCDSAGREYQTGDAFGIVSSAWHHLVAVIAPANIPNNPNSGLANYFTYIDGKLYTAEANYPFPQAVTRQNAWMGLSGWYTNGDANFSGEIDEFNIYNVALTDTQIANRATSLITTTSCTAKPSCSSSPAAVPAAWYELTFTSNPVATQSNPTYTWQQSVATDASCTFVHQGVATFAGGLPSVAGQYVDLNAASGPSSGGSAITKVVGGDGSGNLADGTKGWSFEFTFLSGVESVNAKIFAMGAGEARWNIFAGPDGQGSGSNFGVYGGDGNYNNGASGIVEFVNPISTTTWYHVVAVAQQITSNSSSEHGGAYWIYVNGQLLNYTGQNIYLNSHAILAQTRQMAYLAKSTWVADPYWQGAIDTFRIYDRALTQSQVTSLYQGEMGGCNIPFTSNVGGVSSVPNILPRTADTQVTPIYSLNFATDPRTNAGITYTYGWENVSVNDGAADRNRYHGIVTLNNGLTGGQQWIDLMATSGPTSATTQTFPTIGGGIDGWTFEVIAKPGPHAHWAKLIDIGSDRGSNPGQCKNDITVGWEADDVRWQFDTCDSNGREHQTGDAFGPIIAGQWYHLLAVIAPTSNGNGQANYLTYVNGQLYTVESNFQYPPYVAREKVWMGRSGWYNNNDFNMSVELDSFNVYNKALSDVQVAKVYQQNYLGQQVNWGNNNGGNTDNGSKSSGGGSGLSGGAIAGIVIGSVVGAAVLLALCWVFICSGSRGAAKKTGSTGYDTHQDVSQVRDSHAGDHGETAHEGVELA